jgi:hypothetical protein
MSDGAHLGVDANRALKTILGPEPSPAEDEQQTPEQVRARIESAPLPGDGLPIWDRVEAGQLDKDIAYGVAADSIAHMFLVLAEEQPGLLNEQRFYPDDCDAEVLRGKPMSAETAIWEALKERWPDGDDWIGGASGFMVGFAFNAVRYVLGEGPVRNSAIVEIGGKA